MRQPNILLITDDQHRWDFFDNRTVPALRTPTLDRLRAEGTALPNLFSNCPICMPARMTWTHGLYASQAAAGIMHNWHAWPAWLPSMPQALRRAGYHTALFGKLHAQGRWHNDLTDPRFVREAHHRGYDTVHEVCGKSFSYWVDCAWTHHLRRRGLLDRYRADLERRLEQLGAGEPSDASFLAPEDTADGFIGRHAAAWLEQYDGDRPFFLHASFCGPHFPIDPPAEYHRRYAPADMPEPVGVDDPERIRYWQKRTAAYCAMIEHVDAQAGKLLDILDRRHLDEDTLVLFTTDHGDMMGHKNRAHKGYYEDTSSRTPCLVRWPGVVPAGEERDPMLEAVDLPCTILDAAGIAAAEALPNTPGRSFLPCLRDGAPEPRQWVFAEVGQLNWRMCRERDWKYVWQPNGEDVLHDLVADPWEMENLAGDPAHAERLSRMRRQLIESMSAAVAPSIWQIGEETYTPDGQYRLNVPGR